MVALTAGRGASRTPTARLSRVKARTTVRLLHRKRQIELTTPGARRSPLVSTPHLPPSWRSMTSHLQPGSARFGPAPVHPGLPSTDAPRPLDPFTLWPGSHHDRTSPGNAVTHAE